MKRREETREKRTGGKMRLEETTGHSQKWVERGGDETRGEKMREQERRGWEEKTRGNIKRGGETRVSRGNRRTGDKALESMRAYPEEKIRGPGCWFSLALSVCIVWFGCCCLLKLISLFYLVKSCLLLWICLNRFASPVSGISRMPHCAAHQLTIYYAGLCLFQQLYVSVIILPACA